MNSKRPSGFLTGRRSGSLDHLSRELPVPSDDSLLSGNPRENPTPFSDPSEGIWPVESELGPLTTYSRRAMASDFEILFNDDEGNGRDRNGSGEAKNNPEDGGTIDNGQIALDALDIVDRLEETLTVFKPSSLASRVNALAAEMDVRVSPEVFDILLLCRKLWEETDGAFDITASALWKVWGFARREGHVPKEKDLAEALNRVGMEKVRLDPENRTVAFDWSGMEINFGAIGKGLALDGAGSLIRERGGTDYLIQGGKSSALAFGGRRGDRYRIPTENEGEKDGIGSHVKESDPVSRDSERVVWTIGILHPKQPEKRLGQLRLVDAALGTSGSGQQFFFHKGERLSHIIDPATGQPAVGILSATVLAPTAAEADALSTAFFVMGPEKTERFCQSHPEIRTLLILDRKSPPGFEVVTFNLPPDLFRLTDEG